LERISGEKTVKRGVKLTFPPKLIKEPIVYDVGLRFKVVTNIRRGDIDGDKGWVVCELEGKADDSEPGTAWMTGKGVRVDPVIGDTVEG
jgi:hypothetical protein